MSLFLLTSDPPRGYFSASDEQLFFFEFCFFEGIVVFEVVFFWGCVSARVGGLAFLEVFAESHIFLFEL